MANMEIIHGLDKGRRVTVPADGGRLGRSSKNDIVLADPTLSRHHCRVFFDDGRLQVADLGSANQTLVNDKPIRQAALQKGDRITIGDTVLEVLSPEMPAPGAASDTGAPGVDLGLRQPAHKPTPRTLGMGPLLIVACVGVVLVGAAWLAKHLLDRRPAPAPRVVAPQPAETLEILYEKVEATAQNVFRYELRLSKEGVVAVRIDDVANERHVRKEKQVDNAYIQSLTRVIDESGLFSLEEDYQGIQPNILDSWDLSVTIGRKSHHVRVLNRVEPAVFREVRETIEEFGKNELGLWAIQFSPEKLVEMASDALLLGKKYYDEREIRYGNIADAIRSLDEAAWFLETVDPKPDFYPDIVAVASDAKEVLTAKYNDHDFRAERAIRLRDWTTAGAELRILCELVPDRSDSRNEKARRKLLDIERRLEANR